MNSVTSSFRDKDRPLLIGYLPAGFPTVAGAQEALRTIVAAGVDIVEIGMPYTDPVLDGPVIQRATEIALAGGVSTRDLLATVETVAATGVPVLVMTYWNPVLRYGRAGNGARGSGIDSFARDLAAAGGVGLITPDLIPDEAAEWTSASDTYGLDRVYVVAPSSTDARLAMTAAACRGFVYAASVMGVTGEREQASVSAPRLVARLRSVTGKPVGVGLGVKNRAQAIAIGSYADGVIVGSALVRCLLEAGDLREGVDAVRALATELASGVRAVELASGVRAAEKQAAEKQAVDKQAVGKANS
jgi:tryptophan synthase alpha chain